MYGHSRICSLGHSGVLKISTWSLLAMKRAVTWSACLALIALLGVQAAAHAVEVVHFSSAVPPPSPLKERQVKAQGKTLTQAPGFPLWGHLQKPAGAGPFPAVVLLHGCSGIYPSDARWASQLTDWGYVTLMLDSFGPRSVFDVCREPMSVVSPDTRALDAHGALAFLRGLPYVDSARVAVVGWSHGGTAALAAVNGNGVAGRLSDGFRLAVAFYPYCLRGWDLHRPTLILLGAADAWAPLRPCQDLQAHRQAGGPALELVVYPGAFHGFDVPELEDGITLEGPNGEVYRLQYDAAAHVDAFGRLNAFLARHLAPP